MDDHERTREAWGRAGEKYVREHAEFLEQARTATLFPHELDVVADLLRQGPEVLHPMSGNGVDDHASSTRARRSRGSTTTSGR